MRSIPQWRNKYFHLAMRRGRKIAKVAMARRLAVRLYWMWRPHHTSFLAGKPVMAAGEWIVDPNGIIRVISAKSGHYRPSADELYNFVTTFQEIPGDALIRVDMSTKAGQIRYYRVGDFRSNLAAVKAGTFPSVPGAQVASVISQYAPKCAAGLRKATNMI